MAKARLTVEVEWPDLPLGPIDDMRPYTDRFERRSRLARGVLGVAANEIKRQLEGEPGVFGVRVDTA